MEYMKKPSGLKRKKEEILTSKRGATGIPFQMKAKAEEKTGLSYENVKVHYNSPNPAALQALAYTQGEDIYVGPGQEKHLWHELGHVAQQKEGLVKPTGKIGAYPLNDDPSLEQKADLSFKSEGGKETAGSLLDQAVIQRKQTIQLGRRLRAQGISGNQFGEHIAELITAYDKLDNAAATREEQIQYLQLIMDALILRRGPKRAGPIEIALRIMQDELNFVYIQQYKSPFEEVGDPWEHMNASPFLRVVAEIARQERIDDIPLQDRFFAVHLIRALSRHHISRLAPPHEDGRMKNFSLIYKFVHETIINEGVLSHYSHIPNLQVLHSTDYLKVNQILSREKLAKSEKVGESEVVSKSQDVDTDLFRNTGFIFFFLERAGSEHRKGTGFGKYRYTVRLTGDLASLLEGAWAILHDMAGTQKEKREIREGSGIIRNVKSTFDGNRILEAMSSLEEPLRPYPDVQSRLCSVLSLFLPTADQTVLLQDGKGREQPTGIADHISGNFLHEGQIIDGIVRRVTYELMTLRELSQKEFEIIMKNKNVFWDFVLRIVHDMQIMIPRDVLPEQIDYKGKIFRTENPVRVGKAGMQHISGTSSKGKDLLVASANNCFFDTMFPHMPPQTYADADRLRTEFVARQERAGMTPLQRNDPVEYYHVQQFANLFQIDITVVIKTPGGETFLIDFICQTNTATARYYIKYIPPGTNELQSEAIGHYTHI